MSKDRYPEHLNPFAEDLTRRKSTLKISNSFREFTKTLRKSFRIKKSKHEAEVEVRHKPENIQRLTLRPQTEDLTPALPRSRFQERLAKGRTHNPVSSNPFENDNETEIRHALHRKNKRRAPLPPKTLSSQNVNEANLHHSSYWSLTSADTDITCSTENVSDVGDQFDDGRLSITENFVDFNKEMAKLNDDTSNNNSNKEICENNIPDLVISCPDNESNNDRGEGSLNSVIIVSENCSSVNNKDYIDHNDNTENVNITELNDENKHEKADYIDNNDNTENVNITELNVKNKHEKAENKTDENSMNNTKAENYETINPENHDSCCNEVEVIKEEVLKNNAEVCKNDENLNFEFENCIKIESKNEEENQCDNETVNTQEKQTIDIEKCNEVEEKTEKAKNLESRELNKHSNLDMESCETWQKDAADPPFLYNEKEFIYIAGSRDELNSDYFTGRVSLYIDESLENLDYCNNNNQMSEVTPIPKQRKHKLSKDVLLGTTE